MGAVKLCAFVCDKVGAVKLYAFVCDKVGAIEISCECVFVTGGGLV